MLRFLSRRRSLKLLEEKLNLLQGALVAFSAVRQRAVKGRVMARVEECVAREAIGFEQLEKELSKLSLSVEPTKTFKINAKAQVLDVLSLRRQRLWLGDFAKDLFARRRYWATAVALLLLVVSAFGVAVQLPQVSAAKMSVIEEVRGTVYVMRGAESLLAEPGATIQEGDTLVTTNTGWLDVMFADDSLVTVGPGSLVSVERLWLDPANEAHTAVELDVQRGRLWANVLNLLPNDSVFRVHSGRLEARVDRRASFDFSSLEGEKRMRVFDNLVDFKVEEGGAVREGTLGAGVELVLSSMTPVALSLAKLEATMADLAASDVWVQTNLEKSEEHRERLDHYYAEQVNQRAGVLPGDFRYPVKRGFEQVRLLLTLDEQSRAEVTLALAEKRFAEAMVLANRGETASANDLLEQYKSLLVALAETYPTIEPAVHALLEESKKVVEGVLPENPLYGVRDFVDATSVLVARDESSRQKLRLSTAADRLGLALELIQIGSYDLAQTALEDYQLGLQQVLHELPSLDFVQRKEMILAILDQKLRDLETLKLIALEVESLPSKQQQQVQSLHQDTLYQLNTLVLHLKERAVLYLGTFLQDVKGDEETQREILNRLKTSVPLDFEFIQLINDVEALYADEREEVIVVN